MPWVQDSVTHQYTGKFAQEWGLYIETPFLWAEWKPYQQVIRGEHRPGCVGGVHILKERNSIHTHSIHLSI